MVTMEVFADFRGSKFEFFAKSNWQDPANKLDGAIFNFLDHLGFA